MGGTSKLINSLQVSKFQRVKLATNPPCARRRDGGRIRRRLPFGRCWPAGSLRASVIWFSQFLSASRKSWRCVIL